MARDRVVPFNAPSDTGRMGFRYPEEPADERHVISWQPFWNDSEEQQAYERAVREIQPDRRFHLPAEGDEAPRAGKECWMGMGALCCEIAQLAEGFNPGRRAPGMPRRMSQREWQRRQNELKRQGSVVI